MRIPAVGLFVSHLVCVCGWVFFVWVFHTLLFISFHICLRLSNIVLLFFTLHYLGMLMYNKGMTLLKQLNIRIDEDLYSRLQSHADDTYSSVSQVARVAIAKYLETLAEEDARRDSGE